MTGQELENCGEDDRGALKSREPCPLSRGCITPGLQSDAALAPGTSAGRGVGDVALPRRDEGELRVASIRNGFADWVYGSFVL